MAWLHFRGCFFLTCSVVRHIWPSHLLCSFLIYGVCCNTPRSHLPSALHPLFCRSHPSTMGSPSGLMPTHSADRSMTCPVPKASGSFRTEGVWWGPGFCLSLTTWDKTGIKPLQVPCSLQPPYVRKKSHTLSSSVATLCTGASGFFAHLVHFLPSENISQRFASSYQPAFSVLLFASGFLVFSCVCNLGVLPRLLVFANLPVTTSAILSVLPLPCSHLRTDLPLSSISLSISSCFDCNHFPCRTSHKQHLYIARATAHHCPGVKDGDL